MDNGRLEIHSFETLARNVIFRYYIIDIYYCPVLCPDLGKRYSESVLYGYGSINFNRRVMKNRFDTETVAAIVLGTILIVISYFGLTEYTALPDIWLIQIFAIVVVVIAAVYGTVAGLVIPLAAFLVINMANGGRNTDTAMLLLVFSGVATGHYADKFMVRDGRFKGIRLADYAVVETVVAVLAWVCIDPLFDFYVRSWDLRTTMLDGVKFCGITIVNMLCVCMPLLLLLNSLYKKYGQIVAAGNDYSERVR